MPPRRRDPVEVAELNRETWRYIRSEQDNDYEWLPNPKQKSVLQMPVRDEMIDAWLAAVGELEALLDGKKLMFTVGTFGKVEMGVGINMKKLLEDPPAEFDLNKFIERGPDEKYLEKGEFINIFVLFRAFQMFDTPSAMGYMAWFN